MTSKIKPKPTGPPPAFRFKLYDSGNCVEVVDEGETFSLRVPTDPEGLTEYYVQQICKTSNIITKQAVNYRKGVMMKTGSIIVWCNSLKDLELFFTIEPNIIESSVDGSNEDIVRE